MIRYEENITQPYAIKEKQKVSFHFILVAQEVASRSHNLKGLELNVKLYQPTKGRPPQDTERILLTRLPEDCEAEHLINFVESKSGLSLSRDPYFNEERTSAMITFAEAVGKKGQLC